MALEQEVRLNQEVAIFESAADKVALGDLGIRKAFARDIIILFAVSNGFVLVSLGIIFFMDCLQLSSRQIMPSERIINSQVLMTLLGATTVQLGAVVFTITRAIFQGRREK